MPGESNFDHALRGRNRFHHPNAALAALAARQHGVVAFRQLLELGLTARMIEMRLRSGHLHRIHRGVYAVGHGTLARRGHLMAAVLAGGRGAALSHRAAGAEWNLRGWGGRASITLPSWRRSRREIELHCSPLPADEVTVRSGIPITTVPRTLLDLGTVLDPHDLTAAVNEAEHRELSDPLSLPALLERHAGERGAGRLRAVLEADGFGKGVARPGLEELFQRFVARHSLPPPELNAQLEVGGRRHSPDCLWRRRRVIVELQSLAYHGSPRDMTRDAARLRRLTLAGWTVIYVTWAQLHDAREAAALARDLRVALGC